MLNCSFSTCERQESAAALFRSPLRHIRKIKILGMSVRVEADTKINHKLRVQILRQKDTASCMSSVAHTVKVNLRRSTIALTECNEAEESRDWLAFDSTACYLQPTD